MSALDSLRKLDAEATKGPWSMTEDGTGDTCIWGHDDRWLANVGNWLRQSVMITHCADGTVIQQEDVAKQAIESDVKDAALIVALRNALPEIIAVIEAAQVLRYALARGEDDVYYMDRFDAALSALDAKLGGGE